VCVGFVPGACYSTQLIAGNEYIVIAEVNDTVAGGLQVRPVDTEIAATSHNIDQVVSACRLTPQYPHGIYRIYSVYFAMWPASQPSSRSTLMDEARSEHETGNL